MKILLTPRFSLNAKLRLKVPATQDIRNPEAQGECDIWIIRTDLKVDKALLEKNPQLKLIITVTNGYDHIDIQEAKTRNIPVISIPEGNSISAAELTCQYLLALTRKGHDLDKSVRKGNWDRETLRGTEISGKTLGIVGLGRIGSLVAERMRAFGVEVIAYDPYAPSERFKNVRRCSFEELLASSDLVSLHVPATDETQHMFKRATFEALTEGALFVNTSRGSVVCEADLIEALETGHLAGAALDVFEQEPLPQNSRLFKVPNLILSPHCGANTAEALERGSQIAVDRVLEFIHSSV